MSVSVLPLDSFGRQRSLVRTGAVLCLLAGCATQPDPYATGAEFYERKDYAAAAEAWVSADGDPRAQHALGWLYETGLGRERDLAQAAELYRQAAVGGNGNAALNLALMYDQGRGMPRDQQSAAGFYRIAAEQGVAEAQNNLGRMLQAGDGVERDLAEAAKWLRRAAEQGYAPAQNSLGVAYFKGEGVRQDTEEAVFWLGLAVEAGQPGAERNRAFAQAFFSPQQRREVERRVAAWSPET
jgi:hypothetical protein